MADIVLIDDDPDIRTLARMALELGGNVVSDAANGHVGLELLSDAVAAGRRPLVVLDVQMPDIDGWEVLDRIRSDRTFDGVPVVMCTVRAGAADRARGYDLGADAYQPKPFDLDQLLQTIDHLSDLDDSALRRRRAEVSADIVGHGEGTAP